MPKPPQVEWHPIGELPRSPEFMWFYDAQSGNIACEWTDDVDKTAWTHFASCVLPAPPPPAPKSVPVELAWVPVALEPVPWEERDVVTYRGGRHFEWAMALEAGLRYSVTHWTRIVAPRGA